MSFEERAKRLLNDVVHQTELNILVWGPALTSAGGAKRKQIRDRLRKLFKNADVKFSEDFAKTSAFRRSPLGAATLLPHEQELFHIATCDICIVLDESKGSGEEIAHFVNTQHAHKLYVLTNEEYQNVSSFPASLRKCTNQEFYSKKELDSCDVVQRIIHRVEYLALSRRLTSAV